MIRYFGGEFSTFEEYLRETWRVSIRNSHDSNKPKVTDGYLVPQYISVDKPGLRAWLLRFIGRLIHHDGIYIRGTELVNFHKFLEDGTRIVKCKTKIS